jgi:hypothetical protein
MFSLIKKLGLIGLLFAAYLPVSGQNAKPLDAFFDPATNETIVYLSDKHVPAAIYPQQGFIPPDVGVYIVKPENLLLTVYFKTPGNKPKIPAAVTLSFESVSAGDFRYKEDREFVVKADGETFNFGQLTLIKSELDRSSRGMRAAYYEEVLEATVKLEDYLQIVSAKRVEMTVGKTKFRLSDKKLEGLRSYIQRLKS